MKYKVLVADADEYFRSDLVTALNSSQEFEVISVAVDGEEAIQMLQTKPADILVIDLLLAKYDGLTILELIRNVDQRPQVLVVTAFISNYVASSVAHLGVKALTRKPCSVEKVIENLKRIVNGTVCNPVIYPHVDAQEAEQLVTKILHEIAVPAHIKGYQYLREAIIIAVKDMDVCNAMEKVLYPRVAKVFHTTPQRVIRAMRHAITVVWRKSNHAIIEKHCGYLGGKPNPSQFIEALAEDVHWQLDKDELDEA